VRLSIFNWPIVAFGFLVRLLAPYGIRVAVSFGLCAWVMQYANARMITEAKAQLAFKAILEWEAIYFLGVLLCRLDLSWESLRATKRDLLDRLKKCLNPRKEDGIWIDSTFVSDEARMRHTHVVGATGSGKTVLLEHMIRQDIERGLGCLIIDPKGELSFFDRISEYAHQAGRKADLHILSTQLGEESSRWNPCGLGSASELQTKFYNSTVFSEAHYAKHCERALLMAFDRLCKESPDGFNMQNLSEVLVDLKRTEKNSSFEGLFLDIDNLLASEWRNILAVGDASGRELSMLDAVQNGKIVYVDLPTEAKAIQSTRLGRLMLQEILLISGMRKSSLRNDWTRPFSVYVDEFDAFASESFVSFLNKGRSSGFMIHMAHQTLSDLRKVSPSFLGQIMGNCNVRFTFRQDIPEDAELWSKFFGTFKTTKATERVSHGLYTGEASVREVHEFRIAPDLIKDLEVGRCIYSSKNPLKLYPMKVPYSPTPSRYGRSHQATRSFRPTPKPSPYEAKTWLTSRDVSRSSRKPSTPTTKEKEL
jgi:hypothetical protein